VSALELAIAAAGSGWLLLGLAGYAIYRRRRGLDLVSTHVVAIPEPVVEREAEYDSVRVHVGEAGYDERLLATAAVVMALPTRVSGASVFGTTLETVLAERPCRVIIQSTPPARSAAPAA